MYLCTQEIIYLPQEEETHCLNCQREIIHATKACGDFVSSYTQICQIHANSLCARAN